MHEHSALPDLLLGEQWPQAEAILRHSELALISCLFWWMDIRQVIPCRRLADSLLYVPVKGRLCCRVGEVEREIGPGECLLVAEGVEHEATLAEGCDYFEAYSLHFHAFSLHNRPLLDMFASPYGRLEPAAGWFRQLGLLCHVLGKDAELGRQYGEWLLRALLLEQLQHGNPLAEPPVADDQRVWYAIYRILAEYAGPLRVEELASMVGVSTVRFRKLFRDATGVSPKQYILDLRLRKARVLLQTNPRLTVKEVAEQTGFGDPHHLHAMFRGKYGTTPRRLRTGTRPPERRPESA